MKAQRLQWSPEYIQMSTNASILVGRPGDRFDHTELCNEGLGIIWQHSTDHVGVLAGLTLATAAASSLLLARLQNSASRDRQLQGKATFSHMTFSGA